MLPHSLPPVPQGILDYSLIIAENHNVYYNHCAQQICQGGSIICPFCRNTFIKADVNSLPNNPYALHMLNQLSDGKKVMAEPIKTIGNQL